MCREALRHVTTPDVLVHLGDTTALTQYLRVRTLALAA
jgi:hypothetical protein